MQSNEHYFLPSLNLGICVDGRHTRKTVSLWYGVRALCRQECPGRASTLRAVRGANASKDVIIPRA